MRISPERLLVVLAILLPFIVQIRTVAGFVGVTVTVEQNIAIGVLIIAAVVVWALMPQNGSPTSTPPGGNG